MTGTNDQFQFVSVSAAEPHKDSQARRQARSHAVRQALEKKRRLQRESADNIRVINYTTASKRGKSTTALSTGILASPRPHALDPFETLAVDSSRLRALLGNCECSLDVRCKVKRKGRSTNQE